MNALKKRIALFTGSGIPILEYIAEQYRKAFEQMGCFVYVFDMKQFEKSFEGLFLYHKQGLDAVIVFNNACFPMRLSSGESLWDSWNVPCYNIIVDHPMYYFDTLDHAPRNGIVCCADKYHENYCECFYNTVRRTIFLPTAGECRKNFNELKPWAERSIEVLFIGSYKYHNDIVYDDFDRLLEKELMTHTEFTFEELAAELAENEKICSDNGLKELIEKHRFVDVNTTAIFRKKIIQTLVDSGIEVTVYGHGWDGTDLIDNPNFKYMGLIPPEDGVALMEDTKIVLNHMAWFKAGASERIFEAMLQGAVALTDSSEYLTANFTDKEDIMLYSLNEIELLPKIVEECLNRESGSDIEDMRKKAYESAYLDHRWINRAARLLLDFSD